MRKFICGGPYYQSKIDFRTAMTLQQLVGWGPKHGYQPLQVIAEDSMLDLARNLLLERAIEQGADWLISLDADISLKNPRAVFDALDSASNDVAIIGFPARCGDGRWNVVVGGRTLEDRPAQRCEVERIGTGAIAFRIGWYVKHYPRDEPFFQTFTLRNPTTRKFYTVGEDYGHCNSVRALGGKVICDPRVRVIHHTTRVGSPAARVEEEIA